MKSNEVKFEVIRFGDNSTQDPSYLGPNGYAITRKSHTKDLGVMISEDATFNSHIENIQTKCRQLMGYVLRSFRTRDPTTLMTLWKAIVIPHIDYCSQLWAPHQQQYIMRLEGLQRTFTSCIQDPESAQEVVENNNYWQRLRNLKLYSIERRLERYQIIYT